MVAIVLSKLDATTYDKWETDNLHQKMPTLEELFNFIERRIGALRNLKDARHTNRQKEPSVSGSTHQQTQHNSRNGYRSQSQSHRGSRNGNSSYRGRREKQYDDRNRRRSPSIGNIDRKAAVTLQGDNDKAEAEVKKDPCPYPACGKSHRLWNCNAFAKETYEQQLKLIEDWRLCHVSSRIILHKYVSGVVVHHVIMPSIIP